MLRAFQTLNGYALGLGDTLSARGIFDGVLGVLRQWYGLQNLQARYGSPLMVLNLLKTAEKQPRESLLGKEYELAIDQVNKKVKILRCFRYRPRSVTPVGPVKCPVLHTGRTNLCANPLGFQTCNNCNIAGRRTIMI